MNLRLNETYSRCVNSMSDMSYEEKKSKRMGLKLPDKTGKPAMLAKHILKNVTVPESGEKITEMSMIH